MRRPTAAASPAKPGPIVAASDRPRFWPAADRWRFPTGRAAGCNWPSGLTRPDHPLTARVMVNRVWQHHFGRGLVATPSNFGLRGEPPTHPELLDWLAANSSTAAGRIKALHRGSSRREPIGARRPTTSATWPSIPTTAFYWRFDRRRLDAEAIRDAMLAASGKLDLRRPGEHPFPPIDAWNWTQHTPFKDVYPSSIAAST